MIYLDNSATTNPKPRPVIQACEKALRMSANPGRSGHELSEEAARIVYDTRCRAASFFGVNDETRVIFTPSCTFSLNTAIKSVLGNGGHAVISELEHNAVIRPLEKLKSKGVTFTKAKVSMTDDDETVDNFRKCINQNTKAIICTHASNVFGIRLPVERLSALAHSYALPFILDAAQSAGVIPIRMNNGNTDMIPESDNYDIICAAPHKGLYAPMGTGLMMLGNNTNPDTLIEGGTGSNSLSPQQPDELPDKFESGTLNYPGIAGMNEGIRFVEAKGIGRISRHEFELIKKLYHSLERNKNVLLYTPCPEPEHFVPVLSFNISGLHSEETAEHLKKNGIAVRAGLHCAPSAHEAFGTTETGTVRISPSAFTTDADIFRLIKAVNSVRVS